MLALGIIVPVLPKLILHFRGGNIASAVLWTGIFATIFALAVVGVNEQGELQGAISMLRSVAMLIGPLLFAGVFAYSVRRVHHW